MATKLYANRRGAVLLVAVLAAWVVAMSGAGLAKAADNDADQLAKDKQECAPQLMGLSPCLTYAQGNSKTPTPDCCNGLKNVLKTSKKCLCLLVKYRDDPSLGFKIDANRALSLPTACHSPASVSECPALLHLAPNSPDRKVFDDFDKGSNRSSTIPSGGATSGSSSNSMVAAAANDGGSGQRWKGALAVAYEVVAGFVWLCFGV